MKNQNKPNEKTGGRKDQPSGRQASEQPEHTGNAKPAPSSLNQGQGPDFQTQDPTLQQKNEGIQDQAKKVGFQQPSPTPGKEDKQSKEQKKQQSNDYEDPDKLKRQSEEDLPSREREEKPYVGDNPEETRRQSPKMQ